jgi:hypothetical protein
MREIKIAAILLIGLILLSPGLSLSATIDMTPDSIEGWVANEPLDKDAKIPLKDRKRFRKLVKQAGTFRLHAGSDLNRAIKVIKSPPGVFKSLASSKAQKKFPQVWPYVFAGSALFLGNSSSDRPIAGYYNVYLDAMVLITWRLEGGKFMAEAVQAMTGGTFLSGVNDPSPLPKWMTGGATANSLLAQYHMVKEHFAKLYPLTAQANPQLIEGYNADLQRQIVEKRSLESYLLFRTLLHKSDPSGFRKLMDGLKTAVSRDDVAELDKILPADNVISSHQALEIPLKTRQSLTPVFILVTKNYSLIFQQAARMHRFITSTVVNNQGPPKIYSFSFLDLGAKP